MNDEFRAIVRRNRETVRNTEFEADTVFSHLNGLEASDFIGVSGNDLLIIRSLLQLSIELIDKLDIYEDEANGRFDTYCTDEKAFVKIHGSCKPVSGDSTAADCKSGAEVQRIHKEWCTDDGCEPYDLRCAVGSGDFDILKW